jgi:hypothetical protein
MRKKDQYSKSKTQIIQFPEAKEIRISSRFIATAFRRSGTFCSTLDPPAKSSSEKPRRMGSGIIARRMRMPTTRKERDFADGVAANVESGGRQDVEIDSRSPCSREAGVRFSLNPTSRVRWRCMNQLCPAWKGSAKGHRHGIAI